MKKILISTLIGFFAMSCGSSNSNLKSDQSKSELTKGLEIDWRKKCLATADHTYLSCFYAYKYELTVGERNSEQEAAYQSRLNECQKMLDFDLSRCQNDTHPYLLCYNVSSMAKRSSSLSALQYYFNIINNPSNPYNLSPAEGLVAYNHAVESGIKDIEERIDSQCENIQHLVGQPDSLPTQTEEETVIPNSYQTTINFE